MVKFEVSVNGIFPFPVSVVVYAENRRDAADKGYKELCEFVGVPVNPARLKIKKERGRR